MTEDKVPNEYLLEEIRLNRSAIERFGRTLSGKVGRTELFGWVGGVTTVAALALLLL